MQVETDAHITPHEELTRIVHQHVKADVVHQDNSLVQYQIALEAASGLSSLFAAVKVCLSTTRHEIASRLSFVA